MSLHTQRTCNEWRDYERIGYQRDTQQRTPQRSEEPSVRFRIPILARNEKGLPRFRCIMQAVPDQ